MRLYWSVNAKHIQGVIDTVSLTACNCLKRRTFSFVFVRSQGRYQQLLQFFLRKLGNFFKKLGFTLYKAEQPLQGSEKQKEEEIQKNDTRKLIRKSSKIINSRVKVI